MARGAFQQRHATRPFARVGVFGLVGIVGGFAAFGLTLSGCKRDAEPPATDRTLERLREEVDREQKGQAVGRAPGEVEDPNARLAALATGGGGTTLLPLPAQNPTVHLSTVALKPIKLAASHSVRVGRMELTSEDPFLAVTLVAQNVGTEAVKADLSMAKVQGPEEATYAIASDAQRGGTQPLEQTFEPDERKELTLYFEIPQRALQERGLVLTLPAAAATGATDDVRMPLDEGR